MATNSSILACEIHGQWILEGYNPWGLKESDMTEWLTLSPRIIHFFVDLWIMRGTRDAETQKSQNLHITLQPTFCFQFCIQNSTNCPFCRTAVHIYWEKKILRIVNFCSSNMSFKDQLYIKVIVGHFEKIFKIYINLLFITKIIHVNFSWNVLMKLTCFKIVLLYYYSKHS